jgi:periodic tryptophan protein 1
LVGVGEDSSESEEEEEEEEEGGAETGEGNGADGWESMDED